MRKYFLAGVAAVGLTFGGCSTSITQQSISQVISEVDAVTQQVCGFVPIVGTIESIVAAGNPVLATAEAIGTAICGALAPVIATPPAAGKLRGTTTVVEPATNVPIHGIFTSGPHSGQTL